MENTMTILVVMLIGAVSCYPQIAIGKGQVSASFGGYHASAGLGGFAGGGGATGGLFARAGLPDGTGAAAGLGGGAGAEGGALGGGYAGAGVAGGPKAAAVLGGGADIEGVGGGYAGAGVADGPKAAAGVDGFARKAGAHGGHFAAADTGVHTEESVPGSVGGVTAAGGAGFTISKSNSASSAGAGGTFNVEKNPGTIFDDIFNIPTSVLKAVNQLLNNSTQTRRVVRPVGARKRFHGRFNVAVKAGADAGCASTPEGCVVTVTKTKTKGYLDDNVQLDVRSGIGCDGPEGCGTIVKEKSFVSSAGASASGSGTGAVTVTKNYDDVFNIPISALKSVNQFLNNLG